MRKLLITCAAVLAVAASCEKNNSVDATLMGGEGNILLETTVKNADGVSGQSYLLQMGEIDGTVDLSKGIQIGFSATISVEGNDIFVFPEFGNTGKQCFSKYTHTEKGLMLAGEMPIIPNSYPVNLTAISATKAYIPMYNLGKVLVINPATMEETGIIDLTSYAHGDSSADPASAILMDGYYYLTLNQIGSNWMPYDDYRQVDVVVIDTATDKVAKVLHETKSGLCFPTRPFLKDMIFATEEKDIYMACTGYFGYNPSYLKNGFACIDAATKDFDESKTWEISGTPIKGSDYKASAIYNCKYIGGGKVAAFVGVLELMSDNPYTARNSMAVEIDLKARTIKKIEGVPYTDGHSVAIEMHNGEVYFSAYGEDKSGLFAYNPATGAVRHALNFNSNIVSIHFFE